MATAISYLNTSRYVAKRRGDLLHFPKKNLGVLPIWNFQALAKHTYVSWNDVP